MPKKFQWSILLIGSFIFYAFAGLKTIGYIFLTICTVWYGAKKISDIKYNMDTELNTNKELDINDKKKIRSDVKRKQRVIFWSTLIFNFGILAFLKYFDFAADNVNSFINLILKTNYQAVSLGLLLPLGISFYTFQSIGYLIDVYNNKYSAEKNIFKFALFVSFFPQIIQGPINRFDKLAIQLYEEKKFDLKKFEYGLQLMLWGFFKKLVIADRAIVLVNEVFDNYNNYGGSIIVIGILFYSLQQYADFSGGIDVAMGIAELFGINMSPNFERPYFSRNLSEFWRRWHISLGAWMRDYVFYPLALTKRIGKISKWGSKHLGKKFGKVFPVAFSNIVVFLIVGIWHGPYWHFVAWGLYNGIIIALSSILEPFYEWLKKITKVNTKCFSYHLFEILRTFFIVNVGWYFDRGNGLRASINMLHRTISETKVMQLFNGTLFKLGLDKMDFKILIFATIILFIVSVMQENKIKVRDFLSEQNLIFRWAVLYFIIFATLGLAANSTDLLGGFMYAQF